MVENDSIVTLQSIFKIGRVMSVNGREVKIKVDKQKNLSHIIYNGELIKNVSVGGYVKILNGFTTLIAKVESEYIQHDNVISVVKLKATVILSTTVAFFKIAFYILCKQ